MSALTEQVDRLQTRWDQVEASRRAQIPAQRYISASVLLEKLANRFGNLSNKHRFIRVVTGSDASIDLDDLTAALRRLLRTEYKEFVISNLSHSDSEFGDRARSLLSAMESHLTVLDGQFESYCKRTAAEIESAHAQVKLFKALSISDQTGEYTKLQVQFTMLTRSYGQDGKTATLERQRDALQESLKRLKAAVTFDERLKLSQEALTFVRRILAGGSRAPSLLELTPKLLAELQQLGEFAGTVRILRSE